MNDRLKKKKTRKFVKDREAMRIERLTKKKKTEYLVKMDDKRQNRKYRTMPIVSKK